MPLIMTVADPHPAYPCVFSFISKGCADRCSDAKTEEMLKEWTATQAGDIDKGTSAMCTFALMSDKERPFRAMVGQDAHDRYLKRADEIREEAAHHAELSRSTNIPGRSNTIPF